MTNYKNSVREIIHEKFEILMNYSNNNPRRNIVYTYHPAGEIHAYHNHRFYEFNFILKGTGINNVSGEKFLMKKGDAILLHPDTFHQLYIDENSVAVNLLVYPEFFVNSLKSANPDSPLGEFISSCEGDDHNRYLLFRGGSTDTSVCENLIAKISENIEKNKDNLFEEEALFLLLCSFLAEKKEEVLLSEQKGTQSEKFHDSLMSYTYANYNTVTLEFLAEKFHYSKSHICRIFKHYTGLTFITFLNKLKLSKACELLVYYNYSVKEIAEKTGFRSIEHFYRQFKKRFGMSPMKYKCENKKK